MQEKYLENILKGVFYVSCSFIEQGKFKYKISGKI